MASIKLSRISAVKESVIMAVPTEKLVLVVRMPTAESLDVWMPRLFPKIKSLLGVVLRPMLLSLFHSGHGARGLDLP